MRFLQQLAASVASVLCLTTVVRGSSQARDPLNYLALVEQPRIHTHNQRVNAFSHFDLTFDVHKNPQHIRLTLEPNHDILGDDSYIQFLDIDGNVKQSEKIIREEHKVYQGQAYLVEDDGTNTHVGWARIVIRRDGVLPLFEGAFTIMGDHHHIQLKSTYMSTKHQKDPLVEDGDDEYMIIYRDSDVGRLSHTELRKRSAAKSCGADELPFNTDNQHPVHAEILSRSLVSWGEMSSSHIFGKRQSSIDGGGVGNGNSAGVNLRSTIGDTTGCPASRRVALVGIATDCTYTGDFNSTDSLRQNIINVVNTASDLYQSTFNITLGLRNLTVSPAECPATPATQTKWNVGCSDTYTITNRLNDFSAWRGSAGDTNAYWSLFTKCNTGAEVGLAWLGQLCNHGGTSQQDTSGTTQTVTGANVIARTSSEWQVFAHESGHTFGAVHDCDSSACQNSQAITEVSSPLQETNAETVLLRRAKIVTAEVPMDALATLVVIQQRANSTQTLSVTPAMKGAVQLNVNTKQLVLSAGRQLENVIPRRFAPGTMPPAQSTKHKTMAQAAVMASNAPAVNAHPGISNAKQSWEAILKVTIPIPATLNLALYLALAPILARMFVIQYNKISLMGRRVAAVDIVPMAFVKAAQLVVKYAAGLMTTKPWSSPWLLRLEVCFSSQYLDAVSEHVGVDGAAASGVQRTTPLSAIWGGMDLLSRRIWSTEDMVRLGKTITGRLSTRLLRMARRIRV
ncbi:hypothetical protein H2198_004734 [Neophaeococcomyces mojaviensis]|uniref:Uncharacterized protein n=1 Tax=Neophaeococcomyces mojaviensis TaxID=3383035 RepID=A0ACC3A7L9_9EURO|nr:hypothetical protein H2198_004734 [Knufia sp. JES_112]